MTIKSKLHQSIIILNEHGPRKLIIEILKCFLYEVLWFEPDQENSSPPQFTLSAKKWNQGKSFLNPNLNRFAENPLITPESAKNIGDNINGPSVIKTPDWIKEPLGEYYMYFAHHSGDFIRLAYADDPQGPWEIYLPGTLHIDDTRFEEHIASPDVHVDDNDEQIIMYFHGCCGPFEHSSGKMNQVTDVSRSTDGINFEVVGENIGNSYFRVWKYDNLYYAVANDGRLYMSQDPFSEYKQLRQIFPKNRHFAVRFVRDDLLQIFLTRRGDRPERLLVAIMDLSEPLGNWGPHPHPPCSVLWPDESYEGGGMDIQTSRSGQVNTATRAIRDPAILETEKGTYIYYAVAGEKGIAGAEIEEPKIS